MQLIVNGEPRELSDGMTLSAYLHSLRLQSKMVVVEHNGRITGRDQYETTLLKDGDVLEIVQMMAGG